MSARFHCRSMSHNSESWTPPACLCLLQEYLYEKDKPPARKDDGKRTSTHDLGDRGGFTSDLNMNHLRHSEDNKIRWPD